MLAFAIRRMSERIRAIVPEHPCTALITIPVP